MSGVDRVQTILDFEFPDRVFVVEDDRVWVSGMNETAKPLAERMTEELIARDIACGLVKDDEAARFGGVEFRFHVETTEAAG